MDSLSFELDSSNAMCWLPKQLRENAEPGAVAKLQFPEWGMPEHRGFATATLPDTALPSLLSLPSSRAQQLKLSAGDYINWAFAFILDRIQGASIIIFQLIDLVAVPALLLSRALWSKVLIWPSLLKWLWFVWAEGELCVSSRRDPCSCHCCSISSQWVSVHQLSFIELLFGRLPSCSLPSHLHFGSLFPQLSQCSFLSKFPFFTLCSFFHQSGIHSCTYCASARWFTSSWHPLTALKKMLLSFC